MFDLPKALAAVGDLDSRLEQIANQGKITNGLLALLVLMTNNPLGIDTTLGGTQISEQERLACIALARMAFNNPSSILNDAKAAQLPGQSPL